MSAYEDVGTNSTVTSRRSRCSRPEKVNAFRAETMREFIAALDEADTDDDVRAVVVSGAGKAFSAGADISAGAQAFKPGQAKSDDKDPPRDGGGVLALRIHTMRKPMIAAVNGASVGMGETLTLPMDIRLASHNTRFGFVFVRRGIIPEGCSSWFLPRVVGVNTAAEWMLTGRLISADEALAAGLVRSLHAPDELLPAAYTIARRDRRQRGAGVGGHDPADDLAHAARQRPDRRAPRRVTRPRPPLSLRRRPRRRRFVPRQACPDFPRPSARITSTSSTTEPAQLRMSWTICPRYVRADGP